MQNCGDPNCKDCNTKSLEIEPVLKNPAPTRNVPCNGCTICCQGYDAIRLLPGDDPTQYETEPHDRFPGHLMLAHKENGDCVYLGSGGCSIHDRKPKICQEMDCRNIARKLSKDQAKRYNVPLVVWKRGRQMIGRSW